MPSTTVPSTQHVHPATSTETTFRVQNGNNADKPTRYLCRLSVSIGRKRSFSIRRPPKPLLLCNSLLVLLIQTLCGSTKAECQQMREKQFVRYDCVFRRQFANTQKNTPSDCTFLTRSDRVIFHQLFEVCVNIFGESMQ